MGIKSTKNIFFYKKYDCTHGLDADYKKPRIWISESVKNMFIPVTNKYVTAFAIDSCWDWYSLEQLIAGKWYLVHIL